MTLDGQPIQKGAVILFPRQSANGMRDGTVVDFNESVKGVKIQWQVNKLGRLKSEWFALSVLKWPTK